MMIPTSEKDDKNKDSKKVLCFDEKDIFDFLGVPYREPKDRDVFWANDIQYFVLILFAFVKVTNSI